MAKGKDPLDSEISGSVTFTDTGFEAKLKSRTATAIDRLCGNVVDYFNLPVEAKTTRGRAIQAAEIAIIEASVKATVARIETDPEFAERMMEKHFQTLVRKQLNKDAVAEIAVEEIKKLPPPDVVELKGAPDSIDDDWLNMFESLAEKASTDRLRQLFGKILSGEIRRPGAFSITTLRIAAELDQRTAQNFQNVATRRLKDCIPFFDKNKEFFDFLELESAGLVTIGTGSTTKFWTANENKIVGLSSDNLILVFEARSIGQVFEIPCVNFSRAGIELARLIPCDDAGVLRKEFERFKSAIDRATIHKILSVEGGKSNYELAPLEILK